MSDTRFTLNAQLSGQRLSISLPLTVSGTVNYLDVVAKGNDSWDDCTVTCYLQNENGDVTRLGLEYSYDVEGYVYPSDIRYTLSAGQWSVWFSGVRTTGSVVTYRIVSEIKTFIIKANDFYSSAEINPPQLSEQAYALANTAYQLANALDNAWKAGDLTGEQGVPGVPTDIGEVTATVDNNVGTPSCDVTVTKDPDEENSYNMDFDFKNIKGERGYRGYKAVIDGVGVTVSQTTGTPSASATVTQTHGDNNYRIDFEFDGIKGETGETIDNYVLVQPTQPTSQTNKIWVNSDDNPITLPTPEDFDYYDIVQNFDATKNYNAGDYVTHEGGVYVFNVNHSAGAWNGAEVTQTVLGDEVTNLKSALDTVNDEALAINELTAIPLYIVWEHGGIDNANGNTNNDGSLVRSRCIKYYKTSELEKVVNDSTSIFWAIYYNYNGDSYTFSQSASCGNNAEIAFDSTKGNYVRFDLRGSLAESKQIAIYANNNIANRLDDIDDDLEGAKDSLDKLSGFNVTWTDGYFINYETGEVEKSTGNPKSYTIINVCAYAGGTIKGYTRAANANGIAFYDITGTRITGYGNPTPGTPHFNYDLSVPANAFTVGIGCETAYIADFTIQATPLGSMLDKIINGSIAYADALSFSSGGIESYWLSALDTVKSTIQSNLLSMKNDFSFIFVTDQHWQSNAKKSTKLILDLMESCKIPVVISGGDVIKSYNTTLAGAADEIKQYYDTFPLYTRIISTIGNHDTNKSGNSDSSTYLSMNQLYNLMFRQEETFMDTDGTPLVNVYDNESQKIRIIQFFCDGTGVTSADEGVKLQSFIEGVGTGWTIILVSHAYWASGVESPDAAFYKSYILNGMDTTQATVAMWLVGHNHEDRNTTLTSQGGKNLLVVSTTTDAYQQHNAEYPLDPMTLGTATEQAFDIIQLDTDATEKKIYFTRIGYGSDRNFSY